MPGLKWVEVPKGLDVAPEWTYKGGKFKAPPSPPAPSAGDRRRALYDADGVTDQARLDALWDAVFEGDTKKGKALKATRDKVRKGKGFPKKK